MFALLTVYHLLFETKKTKHQRKSNVIGDVAATQIHLADECVNKDLCI